MLQRSEAVGTALENFSQQTQGLAFCFAVCNCNGNGRKMKKIRSCLPLLKFQCSESGWFAAKLNNQKQKQPKFSKTEKTVVWSLRSETWLQALRRNHAAPEGVPVRLSADGVVHPHCVHSALFDSLLPDSHPTLRTMEPLLLVLFGWPGWTLPGDNHHSVR